MAISASNTGGAWDNAKKYIAAGGLGPDKRKHTPQHDAAVIGSCFLCCFNLMLICR